MKKTIRKFIPKFVLLCYHWCLAQLGVFFYQHPSRKLIVIGVTGTKGKSTVVNLISSILTGAGFRVGHISTFNFRICNKEWANETKQTMPGRFKLQKLLSGMIKAGCQYAVVETSSEGIAQYRHLGIDYDIVVFTNLSPEHIESHGSYKKYRQAKTKLFYELSRGFKKNVNNQPVRKIMVANHDDKEAEYFLHYPADRKFTFGLQQPGELLMTDRQVVASEVKPNQHGISFVAEETIFNLRLFGKFNVYNSLAAISVGLSQEIEISRIKKALEDINFLPGRLEEIENKKGYRIFVDYAHEPASLEEVYKTVKGLNPKKIVSVLGSQGGGRDKAKRSQMGQLAATYTDHVIVTNEDPYDEDPEQIINDVANGAMQAVSRPPIEKIVDRREAIKKALSLAEVGDVVIITGKGSETVMVVASGKKVPWNDRKTVKELLTDLQALN